MTRPGAAGPDRFQGLEKPASVEHHQISLDDAIVGRLRWRDDERGIPVQMEQNDGYLVCYQRSYLPAPLYWVDGRPVETVPLDPGQFLLLDLRRQHRSLNRGSVDCLSMLASQQSLTEFHREHGLAPFSTLRIVAGQTYSDGIVRHLMECMVPAFDHPSATHRLFLDQLSLTLMSHLSHAYGERAVSFRPLRGGLAPWQERRSKELLLAHLDGDLSLEMLARECGLSRAHFARSFKASTGETPMAWLVSQRVARAKRLLAESDRPLTDVALECGFADASHFSRVFARRVKTPPGAWRRQNKL